MEKIEKGTNTRINKAYSTLSMDKAQFQLAKILYMN